MKWLYWLIAIAVVLHLFSCIFMGQSMMPETLNMAR
jgi:hypothetical protein